MSQHRERPPPGRGLPLPRLTRRKFAGQALASGALAACAVEPGKPTDEAPLLLPPKSASVTTTACAYCSVGCGYKVYRWPTDRPSGGAAASDNALGVDFPLSRANARYWPSPEMLSTVNVDGLPHHVLVLPDPDATVVNVGGDYGLGASLAKKLYSPESPSDRLTHPELRTSSGRTRIDWDAATRIIAEISAHVVATSGPLAWGMKAYSYQFYENTYAITKLALKGIMTPCWAPHDKPAEATDAPGLTDAGVDPFSAAYQDWKEADVLFLSGVSLYEAHPVLFTQWVMNGPRLIVVNPRRDPTAVYAEANGGMHLAIQPGTDTLLHNSIAWVILSEGWEDTEFIAESCADDDSLGATSSEFDINDPNVQSQVYNSTEAGSATLAYLAMNAALKWRRVKYGQSFEQYRSFILENPQHDPANAAPILGISPSDIRRAATLMAAPVEQGRPKTSLMLEKGNYWAHNYPNTASLASLGLLLGAGNRPGRMISRAGGHQRGMISGGKYPFGWSPHTVDGNKVGTNLDHWMMGGNLDFCWVIGTTWVGGGTASAQAIFESLRSQTTDAALPQVDFDAAFPNGAEGGVDVDYVVGRLKERIAGGGLVLVNQDIYPQPLTEVADLVLPAASWGEEPFARMQGERRLRFYPRIADPPGEAKPDWWIVAAVARRLGLAGFDWRNANEVFEAAGEASRGGIQDYWQLVRLARERGQSAHDLLAGLGTVGIQCPIRREGDELAGTLRLHETGFTTPTGRALFIRGDWADVEDRQARLAPRAGELWIINRRISGVWNSMTEDLRNPYRASLWSENYVELNARDAESLNVENGQAVIVETQGVVASDLPGGGPASAGSFYGTARLTDRVPEGIAYVHFNYGGNPAVAANNVVTNEPDPINGMYSFKLGRGRIRGA